MKNVVVDVIALYIINANVYIYIHTKHLFDADYRPVYRHTQITNDVNINIVYDIT